MTGKMFPFITETWNPLKGVCPHGCTYCWAKKLIKDRPVLKAKYQGAYDFDRKQILRKFKPGSFVFVCDMLDLFARDVPMVAVMTILKQIREQPNVTFLLLTKNPGYMEMMELPNNVVAGATIESDCDHLVSLGAPKVCNRLGAMVRLEHPRKCVSVEPIMRFSERFADDIIRIKPEFVAVGYDNYGNNLDEPRLAETEALISKLEKVGIKVYRKKMREPLQIVNSKPTSEGKKA